MDDKAVDVEHSSTREEVAGTNDRGLQMPEILKAMTEQERQALETKLRRKLDLRIMPVLIFLYILNYIDRNNIAAAKLAGIVRDLHLDPKSDQFQTAVSILFVGYLLMQVPSNLLLNKLGVPALYLPTFVIIWGIISAATAATTNYGGLLAVRFFLGFVEAAYFPGCLYFLSCWYTRAELGLRTSLFYSGAIISGAFSGLIAAGVTAHMDGLRGLGAWQWLFIIEGAATVAAGIVAYFVLPNFPRTTAWLTEEEKAMAIWRLENDIGEDDWVGRADQTIWHGFKLAAEDIKTWVLLVLVFCTVATGTVTNFFPSVVSTLGKDNVITLLLTAPPYVLCFICMCLNAWHADRTGERYLHIILPLCVALVANIMAAATKSIGPRYTAMMLMVPGVYSAYVVALSWISNTLPRPPAKRAAGLALINAVSNMCSIYASYLYPDSAKPGYTGAFIHNCVTAFVAMLAATVLRFILARLNRRLERGEHVEGAINAAPGQAAEHGFRFRL